MTLYSLLAVLLLASLLVALMVGVPFALVRNMARGAQYREELDRQVRGLRLSKMLEYLGIDRRRYLHGQPAVQIHEHMRRCAACESTDLCDEIIETPGREGADISFCPNADSLTKMPSAESSAGPRSPSAERPA
jgi:hypothetical protein